MKIKRGPVVFHNLLKLTDECLEGEWQTMTLVVRNFVIKNGLYTNAPAFYQLEDIEGEPERKLYSIYVPISSPIELDEEIPMEFIGELKIDDALTFRIADPDTMIEEAYFLLDACADDQGYKLIRPFYHVCFDVFGEQMTDVIAPILLEPNSVQSE